MDHKYNESVMPNGIRLIHKEKKGEIAHLVLMVETGTRDEQSHENGLAHFVEHTIFKGTQNRKAYHILSCLDNVGGDLNAFTTKEETCIQATFLKQHYKRSLDLFADIAFHSTFPENELTKEKEVILDEINSYLDSPSDEIYDLFEEMVFKGHPLSRNILGTTELVKGFQRKDILDFMAHNYSTNQMVLATIGDISFHSFEKMAMSCFGTQSAHIINRKREKFENYSPENRILERKNHLSHCIIGGLAPEFCSPLRMPIVMLNNVLGGPAMSSRLGLNIREKYGFAYSIESQYTAYSDIGLFNVYMAVDPDSLEKAIGLVYKELEKLCQQKLGTMQLQHAKQQLIGQVALSYESGMNELLSATRSLLMGEPIEYMDDIIRKVEAVTADDLIEMANQVFDKARLSQIVFKGDTSNVSDI
jgi:predicted Zn-dependent peptidase